jgi:hypothetical protein
MMESSVKSLSKPVIQRLPVDVGQLDEFACRQLDRVRVLCRHHPSFRWHHFYFLLTIPVMI